jgi:lipoate-protein ligase A
LDTIRLIEDDAAPGEANMAADEAMLASTIASGVAAVRFYRWEGPVVSLGYFQSYADRESHAASRNCPIVRRHSGGGAIVHDRELTYAICWPASGTAGRLDSLANRLYSVFHGQLVAALAKQQVRAEQFKLTAPVARADEPFLCFQRRADGDVVTDGHKIMGSAQRRKKGAILQHGSLLLSRSAAAEELPGVTDLANHLDVATLVEDWKTGIFASLTVHPRRETFTTSESSLASEISRNKFSSDGWTKRR